MTGGRRFSIFLAVLFLAGFVFLAFQLEAGRLTGFDSQVYGAIISLMSAKMTKIMKGFTFVCSLPLLAAVIVLFCLIGLKKQNLRFYNVMMCVNLGLAWLINFLLKTSFHRARPNFARIVTETGFSFPSAHAMISAAFYGFLIYLCIVFLKKPWKQIFSVLLVLLVLAIGVSRVYLGVHYASDVTAGIFCGFAWVILFTALTDGIHARPNRQRRRIHAKRQGLYVMRR